MKQIKNDICEKLFQKVVNFETNDDYSLFKLAQCFIEGYDSKKLKEMLRSDDEGVISDGLFIVNEIGNLKLKYIQDLEFLSYHYDIDIKEESIKLIQNISTKK